MWRLYADRIRDKDDIKSFMKRRFARLYPLHLVFTLVFLAYVIARVLAHKIGFATLIPGEVLPFSEGAPENWASFVQNILMLNAFGLSDNLSFNVPSWTIGAEFYTYIVFAIMMIWFRPKRVFDFAIIGLAIIGIYGFLFSIKPNMDITYDYGFLRVLAGFYTGVLAAVIFPVVYARLECMHESVCTIIEFIVLGACLAFVIYLPGKPQFFVAPFLFVFIVVFAADRGLVSRLMSQALFQYLAKISYSIYLAHLLFAFLFATLLTEIFGTLPTGWMADVWLGLYLCIVIAVSHFTYHFIEIPGGRFIRNWKQPQKQVAKAKSSV